MSKMASAGDLIRRILLDLQKGKTEEFDLFVNSLIDPKTSSGTVKNYLKGLKDCVTLFNKTNESLLTAIMKMKWLNQSEGVIKAYHDLLINLMSANTHYVNVSLNMLVRYFLPDMSEVELQDGIYNVDDETQKKHEDMFKHIHTILEETSKIVPLTPVLLMPILERCYPFHLIDVYIQSCYVTNLLQITRYIPTIRQQILDLIVNKIMKLDVLSPRDKLGELDESDEEEELFEMDEGGMNSKEETKEGRIKYKEADCLDVMMKLLFKYIYSVCHPNGEFDLEPSKKFYWELVSLFEKIILPTHESCHVQFIMFYLASFKPVLADGLLDYLWKFVQNPNTPIIFRQASVSYMASLLARATFIPIHTLKISLDLMVAWLHSYLDNLSDDKQPDHLLHGTFYAVSQAVFYVFCFRNTEIFETSKGYKWAEALNFQRIVTSRLNPLRYCLSIVVSTFSSYTRRHQLAFCDTVIERNNRSMIPVVNSTTGQTEDNFSLKLASFFPFDPYLLPRSSKYIHDIYRVYQGELQEVDNDTEDEDDFLPDDQQPVDMVITSSSFTLSKNMLSEDLMQYATSPGFKTN